MVSTSVFSVNQAIMIFKLFPCVLDKSQKCRQVELGEAALRSGAATFRSGSAAPFSVKKKQANRQKLRNYTISQCTFKIYNYLLVQKKQHKMSCYNLLCFQVNLKKLETRFIMGNKL